MKALSQFMCAMLQTICLHQYFHSCFRCGMRVRSALVALVYTKALRMSPDTRAQHSIGDTLNLISVDAQRIEDLMRTSARLHCCRCCRRCRRRALLACIESPACQRTCTWSGVLCSRRFCA